VGDYRVMGVNKARPYRGLDRYDPFPRKTSDSAFMAYWYRYVEYVDQKRGITTELSLHEMKHFADMAWMQDGYFYDVIYFDAKKECPHPSVYYGVDVAHFGKNTALSWLPYMKDGLGKARCAVSEHYRECDKRLRSVWEAFFPKVNEYGLFPDFDTAERYRVECEALVKMGMFENIYHLESMHVFCVQ